MKNGTVVKIKGNVVKVKSNNYSTWTKKNETLMKMTDTGNGYICKFPSWSSTSQDHYVCLDYAQIEYIVQAYLALEGK